MKIRIITKDNNKVLKTKPVHLVGKTPITIPQGGLCEVTGRYYANISEDEATGILEEPEMHQLSEGLVVSSQLLQAKCKYVQVKVLIKNMSMHPVKVNVGEAPIKAHMFSVNQAKSSSPEESVV